MNQCHPNKFNKFIKKKEEGRELLGDEVGKAVWEMMVNASHIGLGFIF